MVEPAVDCHRERDAVFMQLSLLITIDRDSLLLPDEDKTGEMTVNLSLTRTWITSTSLVPVRKRCALIMDRRARHARSTSFEVRAIADLKLHVQVHNEKQSVQVTRRNKAIIIAIILIDHS
jgi:hypothetical protein